jgi:hypothetical protein
LEKGFETDQKFAVSSNSRIAEGSYFKSPKEIERRKPSPAKTGRKETQEETLSSSNNATCFKIG